MVLGGVIKGFTQAGIPVGFIVANWLLCYIHEATVLQFWSAASH